jgi:hypothetical protein
MAANRKNKSERDREKLIQDRLQILLTRMLQDDDNKYCVDCDSKGEILTNFVCICTKKASNKLILHLI